MAVVLVATGAGCRVFSSDSDETVELPGRCVWAIAHDIGGGCLAIVDGDEIWRRTADAHWSLVATTGVTLASITSVNGRIFAGLMEDAAIVSISSSNEVEHLNGFDDVPGRSEWFGNGPPLHVRAMTATADGSAIMAAVHVGGIPRSTDGGQTWAPTIPVEFDVHEVRAHPSSPIVAAAAAVGLLLSSDDGRSWKVIADGLELTDSLAVAVLPDEVLFSIQDGPFADRSQIWRWQVNGQRIEQVREGLPPWLKGKVDTGHIAASKGQAAVVDGGGDLWVSRAGSTGWDRIATDLQYAFGVQIL
jgi:hypothetical protein